MCDPPHRLYLERFDSVPRDDVIAEDNDPPRCGALVLAHLERLTTLALVLFNDRHDGLVLVASGVDLPKAIDLCERRAEPT